tara:strand:+ start:118 stop:858 length:741 start_codon:yes stop_codon:yes gene_type:complete
MLATLFSAAAAHPPRLAAARFSRAAVVARGPTAARAAAPVLVDSSTEDGEDSSTDDGEAWRAAREARGEYETPLSMDDIDEWLARDEQGEEDETPMTQADIDEWLAVQTDTIDAKAEALLGDLAAPGSSSPPPLPTSGREEWGIWMQSDSEMYLELFVPDETRGKQVRCEVLVGFLDVRVDDVPLLSGRLAQEARPLELQWTLDTQADDRKVLCIELPKRSDTDGPLFTSLRVGGGAVVTSGLVAQ